MKGLVLTYLLTYGGAALAIFNPFVGVCIFWLFDITRPQYMFAWAGLEGNFSEVVAIATIVGWSFKGFGTWTLGRGRLIFTFYILYTAWVLVSAAAAPERDVALGFVVEQLKRTLMFAIAVTLTDSRRRVEQLAWVITGSAGYLALELNVSYLGGFNEAHIGYGGMDNNCLAIGMVTCLGVAAFLGFHTRVWWQRVAAFGCALLISHTILLTFSRGGMLGMGVTAATALVVVARRPRHLLSAIAASLIVLSLAGPEVRARFTSSFEENRDSSSQSRVDLWLDCLTVIRAYPILGAGPDHFPLIADTFGWPRGKEAHSLWLQTAAEIGPVGVLLLLMFYLSVMRRMWPLARARIAGETGSSSPFLAAMVVASLAGFVVSVQFVTLEGLEAPLYVAAIAVALLRLDTAKEAGARAARESTGLPSRLHRVQTQRSAAARRRAAAAAARATDRDGE